MTFHRGEREMQRRGGCEDMAVRVGRSIRDFIPAAAAEFLSEQPLVLLGSRDEAGRVRASLVAGRPGFVRAPDDRTVEVDGAAPLQGAVGLLAIDFEHRRRMRVNGVAEARPGGIRLRAAEAYANCP